MITNSGKRVFPRDSEHFDPTAIPTLSDIAVGLSRQSRFGGQTLHLYTVLAHSLVVAQLVQGAGTREDYLSALLHDAPEAVMCDVPTTWKEDSRRKDEDELYERIALQHGAPAEVTKLVHAADHSALKAEAHLLGHAAAEEFWPLDEFVGTDALAMRLTHEMISSGIHMEMLLDGDLAVEVYTSAFDPAPV